MKILERSALTKNLILFSLLSLYFVFVIESVSSGVSSLELERIYNFVQREKILMAWASVSIFLVYRVKKASIFFLGIFFLVVFLKTFIFYFNETNKLILVFVFAYLVIASNFFLFWKLDLKSAVYHPLFKSRMIGPNSFYNLFAHMTGIQNEAWVTLTNWDESSCFVHCHEGQVFKREEVVLSFEFEGRTFYQRGRVMTAYEEGFGVNFLFNQRTLSGLEWIDYYDIIFDRGFRPNFKGINDA